MENSLILSADSNKSLAENQTLVTTKELAEILSVDISTIQKTIKRLNSTSEVLPKFTQGQTPKFTEEQATIIKQEIQKHHNLASRQIDSVSTDIEVMENFKKAMTEFNDLLNRKYEEEKTRRLAAEKVIELQAPKVVVYDKICNSETLKPVDQVASNLGYGKNIFFALLREMGIFYYATKDGNGNKYNLPKQEYKDRGYFVTKEEVFVKDNKDCLYTKIYVTGKGELWLAKKLEVI